MLGPLRAHPLVVAALGAAALATGCDGCDPFGVWTDEAAEANDGDDRDDDDNDDDDDDDGDGDDQSETEQRVLDACADDIELLPRGTRFTSARSAWDGARLVVAVSGDDGVSLLAVDADGAIVSEPELVLPLGAATAYLVAALAVRVEPDAEIALVAIDSPSGDAMFVRLAPDFTPVASTPMARVVGDVGLVPRGDGWVLAFTRFPETASDADPGDLVIAAGAPPDPAAGEVLVTANDPWSLSTRAVDTGTGAAAIAPQRLQLVIADDDEDPRVVPLTAEDYEITTVFAYQAPHFVLGLRSIDRAWRFARVDAAGALVSETPALLFFEADADVDSLLVDGDDLIAVVASETSLGVARITPAGTSLGLLAIDVGYEGVFYVPSGGATLADGAVFIVHPLAPLGAGDEPSGLAVVKLCPP